MYQIIRRFLHRYQNNAPWLPVCLNYRPFFWRLSGTIDDRQRPPNLVNPVWFWRISRGIWANQKQENILSEWYKS